MPVKFERDRDVVKAYLYPAKSGESGSLAIGIGDTVEQAAMDAVRNLGRELVDLPTTASLHRMNDDAKVLRGEAPVEQMGAPLPRYRSHKEVHALKIERVVFFGGGGDVGDVGLFFDEKWGSTTVNGDWVKAHLGFGEKMVDERRREGNNFGYYVIYKDGYTSWSPTQAFEEGYTEIFADGTDTVVDPDGTVRGEPIPNTAAWRKD